MRRRAVSLSLTGTVQARVRLDARSLVAAGHTAVKLGREGPVRANFDVVRSAHVPLADPSAKAGDVHHSRWQGVASTARIPEES